MYKISPKPSNYREVVIDIMCRKDRLRRRWKLEDESTHPDKRLMNILDRQWCNLHVKLRLWRAVHGLGS